MSTEWPDFNSTLLKQIAQAAKARTKAIGYRVQEYVCHGKARCEKEWLAIYAAQPPSPSIELVVAETGIADLYVEAHSKRLGEKLLYVIEDMSLLPSSSEFRTPIAKEIVKAFENTIYPASCLNDSDTDVEHIEEIDKIWKSLSRVHKP